MKKFSTSILGIIFCLFLFSVTAFNPVRISAAPIFEVPPKKIFLPSATPTPTIKIFKIPPKLFLMTGTPTPTLNLTVTPTATSTPTVTLAPTGDISATTSTVPSVTEKEESEKDASRSSANSFFAGLSRREAGFVAILFVLILIVVLQKFWPKIKNWLHEHTHTA